MGLEIEEEHDNVPADLNPKVVGKRRKADRKRAEPVGADGGRVVDHVRFMRGPRQSTLS